MDRPIKVTVIDDNACILWGLKHLIETQHSDMQVASAVSRRSDVLASVRRHQPDIVVTEIDFEGQCGLDLIDLVKQGCAGRIIVFTAVRDQALQEKSILGGAHGLVLKSEPVEVVLRAIRAVHAGELWLKRDVTARIVSTMAAAYHQLAKPFANSQFTASESRVIEAAVKYRGAPNKVIADVLHMSPNTFRNHLSAIYVKLGIHRRLDLVLYGIQNGVGDHANDALSVRAMPSIGSLPLSGGMAHASTCQDPRVLDGGVRSQEAAQADDASCAASPPRPKGYEHSRMGNL